MKKKGAVAEFGPQRDRELLQAFRALFLKLGNVPAEALFAKAAESPASRFWVSEKRAAYVVSKMLKGDRILSMNPKKREMFFELARRVKSHIRNEPGITLTEATFRAVNSPAPEFYLTPNSARVMIYRIRNSNLARG